MDGIYNCANRIILLLKNKSGQGLVEYELIIALISIAAIIVMSPLGAQILIMFEKVVNEFTKI